ncbi:hybrid sensor histidine kinase/response regulator [Spongiivirga citrea]|uniref:histidine kinase n=1 Tax=Spongiivirga citrea TaxID=1481457 RepID=A0A6M0CJ28_9FLAO|nr:ATP-binding protein [Spongiivirga citrea]NER16993.1 response regulator [Spongiivirga citrea]
MQKNKKSITSKVIFSYVLVIAIAGFAVVFLYNQLPYFTQVINKPQKEDQQLLTISNTLTNLYEAESLGRTAAQTGSKKQFNTYKTQIADIKQTIDTLLNEYTNKEQAGRLDSIKLLLDKKTTTIQELSSLKRKELSKNYYEIAIDELSKTDIIFEDYENDPRLADYDPYVKKVIVDYLEFLRNDNKKKQDTDSLALNVKNTLEKLNAQSNKFKQLLLKKEAVLLENDQTITAKVRGLLSDIEKEVILESIKRTKQLENRMERTANTLKYVGFGTLFITLIFIFVIAQDSKKRQRYQQQLEASKQYAESILKSKEQLMAAVTHDLRSPLTTIYGFTELLEHTNPTQRQTQYLNQLKSSSNFTLQLVNDLLDLSKLEVGKVTIEPKKFDIAHLLKQTFEEQTNSATKPNITYHLEISNVNGIEAISDPLRIKQVLTNLISNAIKFTEKGSIVLKASFTKNKNRPYLKIEVTDTGIGIAQNKQQLIFNEFTQAENETEKHYGGSGLGLTIAKKLSHLLQGILSVDSKINLGSTFTLEIPLQLESISIKEQKIVELDAVKSTTLKDKTVLVVDDDPNQLNLLKALLERNGINVHMRNNAKRAVSFLNEQKIDLIITDIQMPIYDGFWLVNQLKKNKVEIPILALSGKTDLPINHYLKAGFTSKIRKPYKAQHLLLAMANIIEGKEVVTSQEEINSLIQETDYDLSEIAEFVQEDYSAMQKILTVFMENTREQLHLLNSKNNDRSGIGNIAHRMSPMFKQINASKIVGILKTLEFEIKNIDIKEVNVLIEELQFLVKNLFQKIESEINQSHKA